MLLFVVKMNESSFYSDLNLNVPSKDWLQTMGCFLTMWVDFFFFFFFVEVPCKALEMLIISSKMFVEGSDLK